MTKPRLPSHRTARISLTKTQLRTELGAELLSLCESITTDGKLAAEEADALRQWLDDSAEADLPAASYLREVVGRVIADGQITPDEYREVYAAVEAVLPPEVRRQAVAARREVEAAERAAAKAERDEHKERERQERRRNVMIGSANFMVAGVRYEGRPEIIEQYADMGDPVNLVRDHANQYSRNAIAVHLENGKQIGFVPEQDASELAPLIDEGAKHVSYITKILTGGRSPIPVVQVRLYRADSTIEAQSVAANYQPAREASLANPPAPSGSRRGGSWWWLLVVAAVVLAIVVFAS